MEPYPVVDGLNIATSLLAILAIVWGAGRLSQKLDNTVKALGKLEATVIEIMQMVRKNEVDIAVLKEAVKTPAGGD